MSRRIVTVLEDPKEILPGVFMVENFNDSGTDIELADLLKATVEQLNLYAKEASRRGIVLQLDDLDVTDMDCESTRHLWQLKIWRPL